MLRGAAHNAGLRHWGHVPALFESRRRLPALRRGVHHHRADDAPAYFTIVIVGHIVVGLVLAVEMAYRPALWVHAALWLPLTVILTLVLLPSVKGALVGLQWALRMHGFDPNPRKRSKASTPALRSIPSPGPP